jgi:hypothetical protein
MPMFLTSNCTDFLHKPHLYRVIGLLLLRFFSGDFDGDALEDMLSACASRCRWHIRAPSERVTAFPALPDAGAGAVDVEGAAARARVFFALLGLNFPDDRA